VYVSGERADGHNFAMNSAIFDEEGKMISGTTRQTKEIEGSASIRGECEKCFQLVANTAPVMIWVTGVDKLCTYVNQRWLDFTGRPLEAELGDGWSESVHPEDLRDCLDQYTAAFDRRDSFHLEYRLRRFDGEYRWLLDSGVPRFEVNGSFTGYIGSAIDITQHKLAEDALSTVSQRLIRAQEEERAWIAREIHDDIGSRLSLLMMTLGRLSERTSFTEIRDGIGKAIQQATDLCSEMRTLSHRFHSPNTVCIGLEASASAYCREVAEQYKVEVRFHAGNIPRQLPPEVSLCLFRILQEALQNGTKHSGSKHFRVLLESEVHEIRLVVEDTGTGFDTELAFKGRGVGLSSMKERMKLVNGQVRIDSELGRGTTIHARVPVTGRNDD
jgi:PAS domain S-box-containing protein